MSLKPPKKSDLDKNWMKSRRDIRKMIHPEYHLIVTEGTQTEPLYFGAMRDIINRTYSDRINLVITGTGDNTIGVFNKARKMVAHSKNTYKHVWIVYDTDDFPPKQVNEIEELCRKESTYETEYHAIWSNQSIELWFILHFNFMHSDIDRSEYSNKLTMCLEQIGEGKYEKNRADMFYVLRPYMHTAISNAKRLDEINYHKLPSDSAPGTRVYRLVEKLLPYLSEVA